MRDRFLRHTRFTREYLTSFVPSAVELSRLVGLLVALLLSLLRLQLDQVVDPQDGDGSLGGELQALHLNMMKQWNY